MNHDVPIAELLASLGAVTPPLDPGALYEKVERAVRRQPDEAFAAPGRSAWPPRREGKDSPRDLLRDLDTAPSAWRRSEALLRLLIGPRAGEVGGVELDLHREAAARIGLALRPGNRRPPEPERGILASDWLRFETLALQHGAALAVLAPLDDPERRVRAAWLFGDWIGRVLRESFCGVPALLAAQLEAVLPAQPPDDPDALWPARMGAEPGSLRLDEVWLLHALFLARERWEPPGPVLDALRTVASRLVNDAEQRAEHALEAGHDVLGWPGAHLAPPLAARWLLHAWRAKWLASLPPNAQDETIVWLEHWFETERASRGTWVMVALYREAAELGPLRDQTRALWTKVIAAPGDVAGRLGGALGPFCLWGSTYLDSIPGEQAEALVHLARQTAAPWRVGVLLTLAEAHQDRVSRPARDALLALVESTRERELRLPAAVASLQLARKLPDSEREAFVQRTVDRLGPDLRAHPNVRVELKRVGRAA